MAAKNNPFAAGNNLVQYATSIATVGATAGASVVISRQLADRYAPATTTARTKALGRAALHIFAGYKLAKKYPRIAAGVSIGGGVILFDEFAKVEVERQVASAIPPRTAAGGGQLGDGRRYDDHRIHVREAQHSHRNY